MIKGTTSTGFNYEFNESKLSDWRVVKKLSELQKLESSTADNLEIKFIEIMADIESLLFDDHGEALENYVAENNDGAVPIDVLLNELLEVLKSNKTTKN